MLIIIILHAYLMKYNYVYCLSTNTSSIIHILNFKNLDSCNGET